MNITLSVDDHVVESARKTARAMGKSLNQVIRDYLQELASPGSREALIEELEALEDGDSGGWRFQRDELYDRA